MKQPTDIMFDKETGAIVNDMRDVITGHDFPRVMSALIFTMARCVKDVPGADCNNEVAVEAALQLIDKHFRDGIKYLQDNPTMTMQTYLIVLNDDEVKR